jgi:hypothetical protein
MPLEAENMLNEVYTDTPKIIGFLLCILIIGSIAGGKMAFMLLALLLLGQVIFHPEVLAKIPFFGGKA